ncbi:MAG: hypothetical protein DWQ06_12570 [Calditrichaeota bacterium]|nr:MAG: hypothetical protein DWQ06_12570 [Calditrichota bacterium]
MKNKLFFTSLIVASFCGNAFAAGGTDQLSVSPRAKAMGDAFVALANDAFAVRYNPAGLSRVDGFLAGISYNKPYGESFLKHFSGSVTLPWHRLFGSENKFGVSAISAEFFTVDYNNGNYNSVDNELWKESVISFSHGVKLMEDTNSSLSFGFSAKYYNLSLGKSLPDAVGNREDLGSGGTVGIDIGVQATLWQRTSFGGYLMNINRPSFGEGIHEEDLPRKLVVGLAYEPYEQVITTLDLERELGRDSQVKTGVEFWVVEELALRAGINSNPNTLFAGFGLRFRGVEFDYSFSKHPVLDFTNQFGLALDLDKILKR